MEDSVEDLRRRLAIAEHKTSRELLDRMAENDKRREAALKVACAHCGYSKREHRWVGDTEHEGHSAWICPDKTYKAIESE